MNKPVLSEQERMELKDLTKMVLDEFDKRNAPKEHKNIIERTKTAHISAINGVFDYHAKTLEKLADRCVEAFKHNNKIILCGNGGSACDAMHIAGEFVGKFINDRKALPAVALTADGLSLIHI